MGSMGLDGLIACTRQAQTLHITGSGDWTADNCARLAAAIDMADADAADDLAIDLGGLAELDTFGAWILERLMRGDGRERKVTLVGLPARFNDLVQDVRLTNRSVPPHDVRTSWPLARLIDIGAGVEATLKAGNRLAAMLGEIVALFGGALLAPKRFRLTSTH